MESHRRPPEVNQVACPAVHDNQLDELNDALNLSDSKKAAQRVYKKELAAARLCREQVGVSTVQWTASGELVCIPAKKESSK